MTSPIQAPGRQQTSLKRGCSLQMDASILHRRESPMTITHHCFFLVLVLMQVLLWGIGFSDLGKAACAGFSSLSLCTSSTIPRAWYLFYKGILDGNLEGKEGYLLPLHAVTFFHASFSLVTLLSSWHKANPGLAPVVVMAELASMHQRFIESENSLGRKGPLKDI